jgi:hypothetical protein
MSLTDTQLQTLATALRAETDANVVNYLANRMDVQLAEWCNTASASDAWNPAMTGGALFEATNVVKFDNILAGKRDAWKLMLDFTPLDMGRNKLRLAVIDVWGDADCIAVLQACTRKATNGEKYLGTTTVTEKTVTALKLTVPGQISISDVSSSLNRF